MTRLRGPLLIGLAIMSWQGQAIACSWPDGTFERGIRKSDRIRGSLEITAAEAERLAVLGQPEFQISREFRGVITDRRGRTYNVVYHIGNGPFRCSPFNWPEADAAGTFFVKRLKADQYELIHWEGS